jgi:hypothetical protein
MQQRGLQQPLQVCVVMTAGWEEAAPKHLPDIMRLGGGDAVDFRAMLGMHPPCNHYGSMPSMPQSHAQHGLQGFC